MLVAYRLLASVMSRQPSHQVAHYSLAIAARHFGGAVWRLECATIWRRYFAGRTHCSLAARMRGSLAARTRGGAAVWRRGSLAARRDSLAADADSNFFFGVKKVSATQRGKQFWVPRLFLVCTMQRFARYEKIGNINK